MEAFANSLRWAGDFKGRTNRRDFWVAFIFYFAINLILEALMPVSPIVVIVVSLALLYPLLSLCVRRLRDAGFSPWWVLLVFIPILTLIVLGMCARKSVPQNDIIK